MLDPNRTILVDLSDLGLAPELGLAVRLREALRLNANLIADQLCEPLAGGQPQELALTVLFLQRPTREEETPVLLLSFSHSNLGG